MNAYRRFINNHPLANIAFGVVILVGLLAYLAMPREQDPEINFNWINISTVLPGASAEDVENRVTKPLEDAIKSIADVRFVSSSSRENVSSILVRFHDMSPRSFDKRVNDLRREIQNKASAELPDEAEEPMVMEITTSNGFPTAMVLLTGQADDETLRSYGRELRDELERLAGIDQVFALGLRDPELHVEFDPAALAARQLSGSNVADSVGAWFRDTFAGRTPTHDAEWLVRVEGQQADPDYLARLTVSNPAIPGQTVGLGEIASAQRARERAANLVSRQGQPAILLSLTKKSKTNTLELVAAVNRFIAKENPRLREAGLTLSLLDDQTVPTRDAISLMENNALFGLTLVIAICWLFLGTRIALLVGLGIPFSLAGTFAVLHALGFTLNMSVLLGVVIALGMLVDDAVVVVEAIYYRMQRGAEALDAAVDSIREVFAPVTSSVATTLAAFLPLMLLPGIVGKFMFVIPFVVTLALVISLIEAYWMLPAHVTAMRPNYERPSKMQRRRTAFNHWVRLKYARLLIRVLRWPKRSLGVVIGLFILAAVAVAAGLVKVQFFAFDPMRIFYVNVDMPPGVPIEKTLQQVEAVEASVRKHLQAGDARDLSAVAGVKFTDTEPLYGDNYGQVVISLNPRTETMRTTPELVEAMRKDVEATPGLGKITFTQLSGGPPTSKAIKVRVRADDFTELRAAADAVKGIVANLPGARDVSDDEVAGRPEFTLRLDSDALREAGLNPAMVAREVRLNVDGEIVATMRDRGEELNVRVRARPYAADDVAALLQTPIALPNGGSTTLGAVATAETRLSRGNVKHYNLKRAITVEADLDKDKIDTVTANRQVAEAWETVKLRFPHAELDFSGEMDDIQESLDSMGILFLFGVGLIYLILAAQFRSYFQPMMILATVPLAFTGVVFGLMVSANPLSLYTLYGIIALTGIAVNSAIVLIDAANERRNAGMSTLHAIVYAGRRRVVPIIITTTTTIGGLFSLAVGLGGKSLIWGPVASSIVWGLGFATLLTMFVMPLLYLLFMRRRHERRPGPGFWRRMLSRRRTSRVPARLASD